MREQLLTDEVGSDVEVLEVLGARILVLLQMLVQDELKEGRLCRDGLDLLVVDLLLLGCFRRVRIRTLFSRGLDDDVEVCVEVDLLAHVIENLVEFVEHPFRDLVGMHGSAPNDLASSFEQLAIELADMLGKR